MNQPGDNSNEPIRILEIVADQVGQPRNDGGRGSALYAVPFRLSNRASSEWADVFERVWNHPPRFTSMHRQGIAHVQGDRLVLDGTTLEEVQKYHRETLLLCVQETNRIIAELSAHRRIELAARAKISEEHLKHVQNLAKDIRFDD